MYSKDESLPPPVTHTGVRGREAGNACCCLTISICLTLTTVLVILCSTAMIYMIAIHPELPEYDISSFQLTGLPNRTLSSTDPDSDAILSIQIVNRNPNWKADVYYDKSFVNVVSETDGNSVAAATIPGYSQTVKSTTTLDEDLKISREVSNRMITSHYNLSDWAVSVGVDMKVLLKPGVFILGKYKVKARCSLKVDVLSSSQQIISRQCEVSR